MNFITSILGAVVVDWETAICLGRETVVVCVRRSEEASVEDEAMRQKQLIIPSRIVPQTTPRTIHKPVNDIFMYICLILFSMIYSK